jgi:DHA2 family multidrug resistance protein-like MFS transporter
VTNADGPIRTDEGDEARSPEAPADRRRRWLGLAVLALPTILISVDMSVLYLALPTLSRDLSADQVEQLWITDIYGFMVAGLLITMGSLGDRIGRRRLLLVGGALFGVASLLAAFSVSPEMLIAARALMGIAGATVAPSTLALISNIFDDPKQRAIAIGVWMACFMGGNAIGPIIGGVLLASFWWGSVFLLAVPVMVILLAAGPVLLPEYRHPENTRIDLTSVGLSLLAILPFVYGLKEVARAGAAPLPLAAMVFGLAVAMVFVRRQQTSTNPLIDLALFRSVPFSVTLVMMIITAMLMGGTFLFVSLWLQLVAGLTPFAAGLWLVPQMVAMIIGTLLAPILARRVRPGLLVTLGVLVTAIGFAVLSRTTADGGLATVVIGFTLACAGIGGAVTLGTDLIVGSAPPAKAGSAASISETSNELGIALGIAILGSIGSIVYRSRLAAAGDTVPEASRDAAFAGITGAAEAAAGLGGAAGERLLAAAGEAFTSSLTTVATVGAALVLAVVALCSATIARSAYAPEPEPAGDRADAR